MKEALRRTLPLAVCVMVQMVAHGMMSTYFGVMATEKGFSSQSVGIFGGVYTLGAIIAAATAASIILRIGHIRVFAFSTALLTASVILLETWDNFFFWALMRFAYGFAMTCTFVVGDSWFNHAAKNEFRGKIMSIYMAATYAGVSFGQFVLYLLGAFDTSVVLILIGSILSASSIFILLTIQPVPPTSNPKLMPIKALFSRVPVSVVMALFLGMIMSNMATMMPVYLTAQGITIATIALAMLAYQLGGFLSQYPVGYVSDRLDRRYVIGSCLLMGLLGLVIIYGILVVSYISIEWLSVAMFAIGFSILPLYAVNCAHANDRLDEDEMVGAASTLVFMLSLGSLLGPFTTGTMMNLSGANGFLYVSLFGVLVSLLYVLKRVFSRPGVSDEDERSSYSVMPRNVTPITQMVAQDDTE